MPLPLLAAIVLVALALGYHFYGSFIARQYKLEATDDTPAHRHNDGVDFVPTRPFYLFGQHFSAIAAAGPIVGPIIACQQFGWLPCILWIGIGVIFIGAVHDFSTLIASVRHDARSIAEVVKVHMGPRAWMAILTFIWLALIYVIVAFGDVTASTFVRPDDFSAGGRFNAGGAVAMAAILYLSMAIVMGIVDRFLKPPLWLQTLIFVPATLVAVWLGTRYSTVFILSWRTWVILIIGYCAVASVLPVWLLLQPRGYLGGFVLYMAMAVGVYGVFFGGYEIHQEAFKGFDVAAKDGTGLLYPFLFVTIACGACSGFHGLVCSGTTSKQISRESHCRPIGYGAMLLEGFVAIIALATVMILSQDDIKAGTQPGAIYAQGMGDFLTQIVGADHERFARTFAAMALSTFIFDTIDVGTRLGRYILQELFNRHNKASTLIATLITCAAPLAFLMAAQQGSYKLFWTLFGTSNQLLAALSLLTITVWLRRHHRRHWFTAIPMVFVMATTVWSLILQARQVVDGASTAQILNGVVSLVLVALAGTLVYYAGRSGRVSPAPEAG
ncbi:MAG TPA: carbon starvation protein A [Kofleriaceae bacterium]|nr:carbon starvation protein A [Kofleriaceae bacterium]